MPWKQLPPPRERDLFVAVVGGIAAVFGTGWLLGQPFSWFSVVWVVVAATLVARALRRGLGRCATSEERPSRWLGNRPARVMAVASAVFGAVLLAVFLPLFYRDGRSVPYLVLWAVLVAVTVGFNLRTAFRRRERDDDPGSVTRAARPPR